MVLKKKKKEMMLSMLQTIAKEAREQAESDKDHG